MFVQHLKRGQGTFGESGKRLNLLKIQKKMKRLFAVLLIAAVCLTAFNAWSWNHDAQKNSVGLDDTGLTWDEYLKTDEGKALLKQIKMTCAMEYLLENKADVAPYWYVRHGMDDRDNSFAVETTLFLSVRTSPAVKAHNVGFAWLKPHSGDYDVPEAYSWLGEVLNKQ